MPPTHLAPWSKPLSGRYLSFIEREDIALELVKGTSIRAIAHKLGRSPSTISREVRRNAATRGGSLDYRASAAQWHADRAARRPRLGKLAEHETLRKYVEERLAGKVTDLHGVAFEGPTVAWKKRRAVHRRSRRWSMAWSLAPLNGFDDHHAHDALGDVRATIHIARLIRNDAPEIWNQAITNFNRHKLLTDLKSGTIYRLVDRFGSRGVSTQFGVYCGTNSKNEKRIGLVNLVGKGVDQLLDGDEAFIEKAISASPLLIRSIDIGAMPLLFPATEIPNDLIQIAGRFRGQADLWERVGRKLASRYDDTELPTEVEDRIYETFYTRPDQLKLGQFHKVPWAERPAILRQIEDDRLRELGNRLLAIYAPDCIDAETKSSFWRKIAKRWGGEEFYGQDAKNAGNTYTSVAKDLRELEPSGKFPVDTALLQEFQKFFSNRRP